MPTSPHHIYLSLLMEWVAGIVKELILASIQNFYAQRKFNIKIEHRYTLTKIHIISLDTQMS
jgi:hypothetical protein